MIYSDNKLLLNAKREAMEEAETSQTRTWRKLRCILNERSQSEKPAHSVIPTI